MMAPVRPDWDVPDWVGALSTTRTGGTSAGPWGLVGGGPGGLNLGDACGDDPAAVQANRERVGALLPAPVLWLRQVHGDRVVHAPDVPAGMTPQADAVVSASTARVLAIQTADCLPVLLADAVTPVIGAAHAGWRGLAAGILEATIDAMLGLGARPATLRAWIGPGIGPQRFEVGGEVRDAFTAHDAAAAGAFRPAGVAGKWLADLPALAVRRLGAMGVTTVVASGFCTVADPDRFYSYRRDGQCGRMASFIWIDPARARSA